MTTSLASSPGHPRFYNPLCVLVSPPLGWTSFYKSPKLGGWVMTSCLNIEEEDATITNFCPLTVDTYRGAATGGVLPEHSDGQQQK